MKKYFAKDLSKLSNSKGKKTTSDYESNNKTQAPKSTIKTSQKNLLEPAKSSKKDKAGLVKTTKISQVLTKDKGNKKKEKAKSDKGTFAKPT